MLSVRNALFGTLPLILLAVLAEAIYLIRVRKQDYQWRASFASAGVAIGHHVFGLATAGLVLSSLGWVWQHRLFTITLASGWKFLLLFIGVEFFYYWHHRVSHRCRWFWATHGVHHSPRQLNFSAAYRLGWTGQITGAALFFVPLIWLGFEPTQVLGMLALNLLYQFWLHTEIIPPLGWLEKYLNTPSNHRVHHSVNTRYIDANYGGILIVFDRLFGTYVPEDADEPCRYGLLSSDATLVQESHNPLQIACHEWIAIGRDLIHSRNWRDIAGNLFGPPNYSATHPAQQPSQQSSQKPTQQRGIHHA